MFPQLVRSRDIVHPRDKGILRGGYYESIRLPLLICRYAGLLPISGLHNQTSGLTRFTWKSCYSLVYGLNLMAQMAIILMFIYDSHCFKFDPQKLNECVLKTHTFMINLLIILMGRKWHNSIKEIESIERMLPPIKMPGLAVNITNCIMVGVLFSALVEHIFYLLYTAGIMKDCYILQDDSGLYAKSFLILSHSWFYDIVPFNYTSGFILQILKMQGAFMWSFVDGLIMVISVYLMNRFKNFNEILSRKQYKTKNTRPTWPELQVHYTRITRLVDVIDESMNPLVFLSFFSCLLYISQQLFYILNKLTRNNIILSNTSCLEEHKSDWVITSYSMVAFIFVVTKLMLISYLAAELHTASREPLYALYVVPSPIYNVQTQRLMNQVYHSRVCLSGLKLFHVTRGTIMAMVATMMTYELVLLQI